MTPDESREQKAMLLLEHQESESQLANLEEKATRLSERLMAISEWLKSAATDRRNDLSKTDFWTSRGAKMDIKDPQIAMAMDFQAALKLIQEIRDARGRLNDLQKRKQALGLK